MRPKIPQRASSLRVGTEATGSQRLQVIEIDSSLLFIDCLISFLICPTRVTQGSNYQFIKKDVRKKYIDFSHFGRPSLIKLFFCNCYCYYEIARDV